MANLEKLLVMMASPTSREAMARLSSERSCEAESIIAWRSGAISRPRMIFVFMLARTSLGINEGSWVMAVRPTLNFLPSLAMVEKMFGPRSSASFPRTLGASSRMMLTTGLLSRVP